MKRLRENIDNFYIYLSDTFFYLCFSTEKLKPQYVALKYFLFFIMCVYMICHSPLRVYKGIKMQSRNKLEETKNDIDKRSGL